MRTLVVGSGSLTDYSLLKERFNWADLVIAADGGAIHLHKAKLKPHVLLGDFDSVSDEVLKIIQREKSIEILSFPAKKDYTDMELAIDLALQRGASEFVIMGASGTRLDHTISNIHMLYMLLERNIPGCIEDDNNQVYLIKDRISLKKQEGRKVSLLAISDCVRGLTTSGLSYPLEEAVLSLGRSLGVSNEFCEEYATITIKEGLLLVLISND